MALDLELMNMEGKPSPTSQKTFIQYWSIYKKIDNYPSSTNLAYWDNLPSVTETIVYGEDPKVIVSKHCWMIPSIQVDVVTLWIHTGK
jgi:hypothetical protein